VNLSIPIRIFVGNSFLAFTLKQAIATFDEPIVHENWNLRAISEYDFKGFLGSSKMRGKGIINLASLELFSDLLRLRKSLQSKFLITPSRENSATIVKRFRMTKNKQFENHQSHP
jgi:hypothetical protein